MAIYVTGDMHGDIDIKKFTVDKLKLRELEITAGDYMIIAGDFGLLWTSSPNETERYWKGWLEKKPWTTLFVDGNHENFERINALPEIEMFGSKVGQYGNKIFHLKRGMIYNIQGKSFFTMGGGVSIDKQWRRDRISWWTEEMPSYVEYMRATETLKAVGGKVDYVITHTAPDQIRNRIMTEFGLLKNADELSLFLQSLDITFKKWYFAHYHVDTEYEGKYYALYKSIVEVK